MSDSRPDDCSHCAKPCHVHLTKVIDGKVIKLGVCSNCPHAKAYKEGQGFDLIKGLEDEHKKALQSDGGIACPSCGLTPKDFKEYGRLGCPDCYSTFEEKLQPLYRKLHNDRAEHVGKRPREKRLPANPEEIAALKRRMEEHVIREEYELAAVVRDQIRSLES